MKFILGTKLQMSQIFLEDGTVCPVTLIQAGPVVVTQMKNKEKEGYESVQVGSGQKKKISKPLSGHLKGLGNFRWLREVRLDGKDAKIGDQELAVGAKIDVSIFQPGDMVKISGVSKGKGFQGGVKRHGFKGGPRTHGQKHSERAPGSIGGGARAGGRVAKGMRMAGRMGGERITVKGLRVMEVDPERNILTVKGAVPGRRGTLLEIKG